MTRLTLVLVAMSHAHLMVVHLRHDHVKVTVQCHALSSPHGICHAPELEMLVQIRQHLVVRSELCHTLATQTEPSHSLLMRDDRVVLSPRGQFLVILYWL